MKLTYSVVVFLLITAGVAAGLNANHHGRSGSHDNPAENVQKPNIILIMVDDMGREALGTYGSAVYNTPNLDKLAEKGVKFENMFAQPLCTPSRVKIMTGKYNFRNYTDFGYLNPQEETFGNILQDAGYSTMIAGKWQLNGRSGENKIQGWDNENRPYHFGFDEYSLWQVTKRGKRYANPLIVQNGRQLPRDKDAYGPNIFTDYILNFIDRKKYTKNPFFIYYPMVLVHNPFVPTPDSPEWKDPSKRYQDDNRYFKDEVAYMDKIVGKIMDKLKQNELSENTLVIFTADNGTNRRISSKMENGQTVEGMKGHMVDWGTRVPLISYWKGKSLKGSTNDQLLDFTDVLPTLLDAAGIHALASKVVDGQSFLPLILGEPAYASQYIYMYYKPDWGGGKFENGVFARNKTYKLYGNGRFYDVENDVKEQQPIPMEALDEKQLKIREKLQNVLDKQPAVNARKNKSY